MRSALTHGRTTLRCLLRIGVVLTITSCALTKTKFTSTWKPGDARPVSARGLHVATVFINSNESIRRVAENALAQELVRYGSVAYPSYTIVNNPRDIEAARKKLQSAGVDAIVSMRVVSNDIITSWTPTYYNGYSSVWGYWRSGWDAVYAPGYVQTDTRVGVETLFYSVRRDKLLWAGISETFNPQELESAVHQIAKKAIHQMDEDDVLAK